MNDLQSRLTEFHPDDCDCKNCRYVHSHKCVFCGKPAYQIIGRIIQRVPVEYKGKFYSNFRMAPKPNEAVAFCKEHQRPKPGPGQIYEFFSPMTTDTEGDMKLELRMLEAGHVGFEGKMFVLTDQFGNQLPCQSNVNILQGCDGKPHQVVVTFNVEGDRLKFNVGEKAKVPPRKEE